MITSYRDFIIDFCVFQPTVEDNFQWPAEDKTELAVQCNNYRHTGESEGSCK
jgi:hypothetical protein